MENNFGFLFKKSSLPKSSINLLLQYDDFVKEANDIMSKGHGIEDIDLYSIVKKIYFPMMEDLQKEGFKENYKKRFGSSGYKEWSSKYKIFGDAIRGFSKALFGSTERWKNDYLDYSQQ